MGWIDIVLVCTCLAAIGAWYGERSYRQEVEKKLEEEEKKNLSMGRTFMGRIRELNAMVEDLQSTQKLIELDRDSMLLGQQHKYQLKIKNLDRKLCTCKKRNERLIENLRKKKGTKKTRQILQKIDKSIPNDELPEFFTI